jgi:hypothetical protein
MTTSRKAFIAAFAVLATAPSAAAGEAKRYVLEAIGAAESPPEIYYVMMKMESQAPRATDAITAGEKRLREFLAAVDSLKLPDLAWRVSNNVFEPVDNGYTPGALYVRNIVFTLPRMPADARDAAIAKLEDLGARYNSHCVTCIGSG